MKFKIVFIGAGSLATHLSIVIQKQGHSILQVYSRTEVAAMELATLLKTEYTTSVTEIEQGADIYFVVIKDSVFGSVLSQISFRNKLVVHCSGSLPLSVLQSSSKNIGVFYPLQTFSKNREINFNEIPVFIEANSVKNKNLLTQMALEISNSVSVLDSETRRIVHLSAVFACNFVNHFYSIASELLASKEIPFDVLRPLILETALKVQELSPINAQTGPAVRFDQNIILSHLNELENFPEYQELYNSISKRIFEHHKKN